jgi:prevent-host-death family protein
MATIVNVHEAKTHLSRLLDRAAAGEEIVVARAGRPVARLIALAPERAPRVPGHLRGKIATTADFDDTPGWLIDAFDGSSE